jgi:hypothetical protein
MYIEEIRLSITKKIGKHLEEIKLNKHHGIKLLLHH